MHTLGEAICFSNPVLATEAIGATADLAPITEETDLGRNERRERSAGNEAHDGDGSGGMKRNSSCKFNCRIESVECLLDAQLQGLRMRWDFFEMSGPAQFLAEKHSSVTPEPRLSVPTNQRSTVQACSTSRQSHCNPLLIIQESDSSPRPPTSLIEAITQKHGLSPISERGSPAAKRHRPPSRPHCHPSTIPKLRHQQHRHCSCSQHRQRPQLQHCR